MKIGSYNTSSFRQKNFISSFKLKQFSIRFLLSINNYNRNAVSHENGGEALIKPLLPFRGTILWNKILRGVPGTGFIILLLPNSWGKHYYFHTYLLKEYLAKQKYYFLSLLYLGLYYQGFLQPNLRVLLTCFWRISTRYWMESLWSNNGSHSNY